MADSVRELIIQSIATKFSEVQKANGYNTNIGKDYIERGRTKWGQDEQPSTSIFPGVESSTLIHGMRSNTMPVVVVANKQTEAGVTISEDIERILADLVHCALGPTFTFTFNQGKNGISQGDTITGATSSATAVVMSVTISSGSWGAGNAAGTIRIRDMRGTLTTENIKVSGVVSARITAGPTIQSMYGGMIDRVEYVSGGPENYPELEETTITVRAMFNFIYSVYNDNPYLQRSLL